MALTLERPADRDQPARWRRPSATAWAAVLVGLLAFGLRFFHVGSRFDVFVDEFVYQGLGHSVRDGGFPRSNGELFFLHPPGFFYLEGLWEHLTGPVTDLFVALDRARALNSALAGVSAAAITSLAGRLSWRWGLCAGLVFAVEPFALRQNGRVLLETATLTWVLLGLLVLLPLAVRPDRRHASLHAVGGGLLFGMAVLTKDISALLTVLPLAMARAVLGREHRGWLLDALLASLVPYACYVLALAAGGNLAPFVNGKLGGLARASGAQVTTGFNGPGTPPLLDQVRQQLLDFSGTYSLIVLGGLGAVVLLRHGSAAERLLALVHGGGAFLLGYSFLFGTLEEQFLYFLLVPSLVCAAAGAARLLAGTPGRGRHRVGWSVPSWTPRVLVLAAVVLLCLDASVYLRWTLQPDDGYARLRTYLAANVPDGSSLIIVNGVSEFALRDRYDVGPFTSDAERRERNAQYLVVPEKEVQQGYSYVDAQTVALLEAQGTLVFRHEERTYDEVSLYRIPVPPS